MRKVYFQLPHNPISWATCEVYALWFKSSPISRLPLDTAKSLYQPYLADWHFALWRGGLFILQLSNVKISSASDKRVLLMRIPRYHFFYFASFLPYKWFSFIMHTWISTHATKDLFYSTIWCILGNKPTNSERTNANAIPSKIHWFHHDFSIGDSVFGFSVEGSLLPHLSLLINRCSDHALKTTKKFSQKAKYCCFCNRKFKLVIPRRNS